MQDKINAIIICIFIYLVIVNIISLYLSPTGYKNLLFGSKDFEEYDRSRLPLYLITTIVLASSAVAVVRVYTKDTAVSLRTGLFIAVINSC